MDAPKRHSSMTLCLGADATTVPFKQVLDRSFGGTPDAATHQRL